MAWLSDLFSNKLFLQYLSGAGAEIAAGGQGTEALNQITQQNIAGQSMMGLLQKMLGGEGGEGSKMSVDGKGVKMQFDPKAFGSLFGQEGGEKGYSLTTPGGPGPANVPVPTEPNLPSISEGGGGGALGGMLGKLLNPSSSLPNVSASDLAGLSTADILNALSGTTDVKKLDQKKVTDLIDMIYKGALTKESRARTRQLNIPKDERTAAIKNYEYALAQGSQLTFEQWVRDARTTHGKDYERAVAEGYTGGFQNWLRDMTALGGGLSLEQKVTQAEAMADVKSKKYFSDPTKVSKDLETYLDSADAWATIQGAPEGQQPKVRATLIEEWYESKIKTAGGKIVSKRLEGKDFVWTVKWPNGATSEVIHAN